MIFDISTDAGMRSKHLAQTEDESSNQKSTNQKSSCLRLGHAAFSTYNLLEFCKLMNLFRERIVAIWNEVWEVMPMMGRLKDFASLPIAIKDSANQTAHQATTDDNC